jgi:hypothetical protein
MPGAGADLQQVWPQVRVIGLEARAGIIKIYGIYVCSFGCIAAAMRHPLVPGQSGGLLLQVPMIRYCINCHKNTSVTLLAAGCNMHTDSHTSSSFPEIMPHPPLCVVSSCCRTSRKEQFSHLSLQLPPDLGVELTISELLAMYFAEEAAQKDCEACKAPMVEHKSSRWLGFRV